MLDVTASTNVAYPIAADRAQRLARSFLDLERMIIDLRGASAVLDIVAEDTVLIGTESSMEVFHLSSDQIEALGYALNHVGSLIRQLHHDYNTASENADNPACRDRIAA